MGSAVVISFLLLGAVQAHDRAPPPRFEPRATPVHPAMRSHDVSDDARGARGNPGPPWGPPGGINCGGGDSPGDTAIKCPSPLNALNRHDHS